MTLCRAIPRKRLLAVIAASRLIVIGACCLTIGGCHLSQWAHNGFRLGPNYKTPIAQIADDWIDSNDPRVLPLPPSHPDWWAVLQDPVVNNLVQVAFEQNLTLRQAGMRVMQSRSSRAIAAGNLFPQEQQSFGDFSRIQNSQTIALASPVRNFDEWEVGFNASWELDVWGKFRRAVESADASLEASIRDYDAILISLIAEVVTAYVDVRTFEQRLAYARQNVKVQDSSLEFSSTRFNEGKTSQVGVYLAEANLNGTKATIPSLKTGLRQANNRLCTLLAIAPMSLSGMLGKGNGIPHVPSEIAVGIPSDLIRRRPDVRQAERLVAAQSAQIGVAQSDLYPSIAITGEVFLASENFTDLFRSSSSAGSVGPSFGWNILNYGRIINNVRLQDARLLELVANYQNTVLEANQEVEDALVAFLNSQEEVKSMQATVDDLNESLKLLLINFEEGSIDFSPIFVLQESLRSAQDQLAAAEGNVVVNLIAVYRALGGGWQIRCPGFQPQPPLVVQQPVELIPTLPGDSSDSDKQELNRLPAPKNGSSKDTDNG
jgi:NodT family efflux transporter outer membrane factor (OMF) lipoprotein